MERKVWGYTRVSTEEQAESSLSLDSQERRLRAYCEAHDLELLGIVSDPGISAKDLNRPGIQSVLASLRAGNGDGIIVAKLDRFSRSTRDILAFTDEVRERGWSLHSLAENIDTSTASGRMFLGIMALFSEFELENIRERTKTALTQKKIRGEKTGGACIRLDEPDPKNPGKTKGDTLRANLAAGRAIAHAKRRGLLAVGVAQ